MSKSKEKTYLITEDVFVNLLPFTEPKTAEVSTQKEMLSIPWIKAFSKHNKFARFSISPKEDFKWLMIEDTDCKWWWPVAKLPLDFSTDLPIFKSVLNKPIIEEENELQEVPESNTGKKKKSRV